MKYMGSKARYAKDILPIILQGRTPDQWYVEPFAGGMNVIDKVSGKRMANDINYELIQMWDALVNNDWRPPLTVNRDTYSAVRANKGGFDPWMVGWVGFNCSYSGKYFGGYAGQTRTKDGTIRDYQEEAYRNIMRQIPKLKGVVFTNTEYCNLTIPANSVVYCDPPYQHTTGYSTGFDHRLFWDWVRDVGRQGHVVWVSEYDAPNDFECVWEKQARSSLSANGKIGGSKLSTEKLFKLKSE